jgi:hypothetical protein
VEFDERACEVRRLRLFFKIKIPGESESISHVFGNFFFTFLL